MNNNEIVGYNLLAKRAIETESGVNIDEALRNITAYKFVAISANTGKPETTWGVSDKILYITQSGQNQYRQWIWNGTVGWICIGETSSPDSWKKWSEDHGSSSTVDGSVYIGPENEIDRPNTYVLGKGNKVTKNSDTVEIADTDVVSLGTNNEVINGANAYQLGRDNKVIGNNLSSISSYPEQVAINIGQGNTVKDPYGSDGYSGEGVNIGKNNTSSMFGISIGQNNTARGGSIVIGENLNSGDSYATTIIGHEKQCYTVSDFEETPVLNGVPLGKYELIDFRTIGHEVSNAWFDVNGKPIEIKRYYVVVNRNTDEVKFEEDNNNYYITYNGSKYGYIDDNGFLVDSNESAPSGKVKDSYCPYYSTRDQANVFWGTTYYTRYLNLDEFTPVIWKTYKLSEVSQYFITSSLGNVYISDTEAYAKSYDNGGFILYKVRVTGKDVDGVFTPWFNNNFDLSECTTRDFYPSDLSYSSNITVPSNLAIKINEETTGKLLTDVMYGGTLFGPLATVEYGGIGITQTHGDYIRLKYTALPGYTTVTSTKYYLNGSSSASTSSKFCTADNVDVLTPSGILNIIKPIVHNGAVGIAAMTGDYTDSIDDSNNFSTNLEVSYGAIGIGDRMYVDSGAIGIGRNQTGIGSGSIALGVENKWGTTRSNCSYGATLIGRYNTASYDSNLLSGATVVGNNNYFDNYASGAVLLGNYNRFADNSGGYGSVLVGVNSSIKGSGSIAIGTGYNGGGGAHARYGAVAISYKGAIADCGSTALGGNGCVAYYGAASMGWNGCTAMYGGLSLGWSGIMSIYGSVAIGHDGVCGIYGGYAMGWSGSCAQFGSISLGYYGAFARNGAMAIGHHGVNAYNGAIALGYNNAYADDGGIAIGMQTVKGKNGSIAMGLCGTYAESGSVSIGHKSHAFYGSMSLVFNNTSGPDYSFQVGNSIFVQYAMPDEYGRKQFVYPEFRVLKGLPVRVDRIYAPNGILLDTIENPSNGKYSVYKSNAGKYYDNLSGIPSNEWMKVWIRATKDENNAIVPFRGMETNFAKIQRIVDNWIEVPISRTGDPQIGECAIVNHPSLYDLEMDCSVYGGITIGGKAFAANGAVSIGTDNCQNSWSVSDTSVTVDGNSVREYTRRAGYTNNGRFYPWGAYQAYAKNDSVAIGSSVIATGASIAMGISPVIADYGSLALSYGGLNTYDESENDDIYGKAEGNSLLICGMDNTGNIIRRGFSSSKSIAIGTGINASNQAIAIGDRSYASNNASAIGTCSTASNQSYSMGDNASADRRSVSIGAYSRTTDASIAIGDDNEAGLNAFAIGTKNLSYGWSMLFGVDNKTPRERGAHATIIGYNNTSTSNIEKLEKTLRVKYDKQTALSKLAERYTVIHNAQLNLGSPYMTSSELNRVMSYESALYDYYANGGTYPSYDSEYAAIKTALFSKPMISMDASTWDSWSNLYTYGVYYLENALYYLESYGPSDSSYTSCRDYVYTYAPAFVDIMISYATDHMPSRYLSALIVAKTTLENRPEIIPSSLFNEQSKYMEIVNLFLDSYRNKDYSYTGSMPTESQFTYYTYETELNKLLNNMYGIRTGSDETVYIDEIEEAICNSVIFGANNTSNHYNSILVGTKNQSLSPVIESAETDDDGFMMAIGFKNTVGRNYDIAIGYMSTANGGENVAIQHSTAGNGANSFHNLAMFDSTAIGIGNIAIQQSEASGGVKNLAMFESKSCGIGNIAIMESEFDFGDSYQAYIDNYVTHNVLFNSKFTGNLNTYQVDQNTLFNAKLNYTTGYGGVASNVIGLIDANLIGNSGIHNNIICGQHTTEHGISINISDDLANNFLIHCGGYSDGQDFTDNTMVGTIIHATSADLCRNIAISAKISANNALLVDNLVLQSSEMNIDGGNPAESNVLLSGALLAGGKLTSSIPPKKNLLFGAGGVDVYGCFAMSDEPGAVQITNSRRVFMFGDNNITETENVQVLGDENIVHYTNRSFIAGTENNISPDRGGSRLDSSYGSSISESVVIGDKNKILSHNGVHVHRNVAIGCVNTILGDETHENTIIGQYNRIYNITEPTVMSSNAIQNGIDNDIQLGKFTSDRDCLVSSRNKPTFSGYFYSGEYYYENGLLVSPGYDDRIRQLPKVNITVTQLINSYGSGTLTNHTLYNATGSSVNLNNISFKVYSGIIITAGVPYIVVNGTPDKCDDYDVSSDYSTRTVGNRIFGSENELNGLDLINNTIVGYNNYVCRYGDKNGIRLTLSGLLSYTENDPETYFCPYGNYAVWDGRYIEKFYSGSNYTYANGMLKESWFEELPTVSIAPAALYQGTIDHTLQSGVKYAVTNTSTYTLPSPIQNYKTLSTKYTYKIGGGLAYPETVEDSPAIGYGISGTYGARLVQDNIILGSTNGIHENIIGYTVIGKLNNVICTETVRDGDNNFAISCGFIQGNNNIVTDGSNIICMGNGNESTGHNSVAIGSQLISRQWQTVIGKYNVPIDGPNRLESENPKDPSKALFIIGNGFSTTDGDEWMNPDNITRSNAMVVFADGTVRAKKFVSDEPELELVNGTGIVFNDDLNNNRRTISVTADIANLIEFLGNRPAQGTYAINSVNGTLTWVQIGSTQV